jgi:hypothetical protein
MPLYTFLHSLLNVLAQIANKMGLQKKCYVGPCPHSMARPQVADGGTVSSCGR